MAQESYRKLTPLELRRLGYSERSERYVPVGSRPSKTRSISRRQYDSFSGKYDAWGGRHNFERRYSMPSYRYFVERLATVENKTIRQIDIAGNKDTSLAFQAAKAKARGGKASRSSNGPLARYLVRIGLRKPEATYDVGDTPPA